MLVHSSYKTPISLWKTGRQESAREAHADVRNHYIWHYNNKYYVKYAYSFSPKIILINRDDTLKDLYKKILGYIPWRLEGEFIEAKSEPLSRSRLVLKTR